jgi:hypothetical protein
MRISSLFYCEQAAAQQVAANVSILKSMRARNQRAADSRSALADMQDRIDAAHSARIPVLAEPIENPDRGLAEVAS